VVPIVLQSGNYLYKFNVDGDWITDPVNPAHAVKDKQYNSFLAVNATHTFQLDGYPNAYTVHLAGSFNNWNTNEYLMGHTGNEWSISLYLKPGKQLYKFLVDDKWMIDPGNKLWEQNQFNTDNSVLWIE
jgi:1,4-alpha-glucan branching enzyme